MSTSNEARFRDLTQFNLDPASIRRLPQEFCRRNQIVVLGRVDPEGDEPVTLGMVQPDDARLLDEVRRRLGRDIEPVRLNGFEVERALALYSGAGGGIGELLIPFDGQDPGPEASPREVIDHLLQEAVRRKASDIHIETYFNDVDVRLRIDGMLHQHFTHLSPESAGEVISRLKITSNLDIAERRKAQDGRFRAVFTDGNARKPVDFRVSVVPSPAGEDAVIRVLDASQGLLPLSVLGMPRRIEETFTQLLNNPEGMVLVTGPTGSGKTTTLYAALNHLRTDTRKIITAEDPIEYYIDKINQKEETPVMSMAQLIRALMRQDPNVLLFGEIRDRDMGELALEASATGHVVLSTLHTADAVGAVVRLRSLDLEDVDIATALLGVIGQRLVRQICPQCATPTEANARQTALFGVLLEGRSLFKGVGCDACRGTGVRGRVGLFELLVVDEALQDMIAGGNSRTLLKRYAREHLGFRTMLEDGLDKLDAGGTTLDELERVLPFRQIVTERLERGEKAGQG